MTREHPDDTANREHLRTQLVQARHDAGYTQRSLATHLGLTCATIHATEHHTGWFIPTLMRHARAINTVVEFTVHNLPDLPPTPLDAVRWPTAEMEDEYTAEQIIARLADARTAVGLNLREMAERFGGNDSVVSRWELRQGPRGKLATAQRYARCLGGVLVAELAYLDVHVGVAA